MGSLTTQIQANPEETIVSDLKGPFGNGNHTRAFLTGLQLGNSGCGCLIFIALIVIIIAAANGFQMH